MEENNQKLEGNSEIENNTEIDLKLDLELNSEDIVEAQDETKVEVNAELNSEVNAAEINSSELSQFEAAPIEEVEFVELERLESIIESVFFASDTPVSLNTLKEMFKGTNIKSDHIRRAVDALAIEYAGARRGVTLEEVTSGWQLRTKLDNVDFIKKSIKSRPFKVSGPALEVLSIVAYKQPIIKSEIDEIRGVESGHLLRALMEKGLVNFAGKSELPGRPMQYGTSRKFLEIFGLRNINELPSLSQIDELLPEGIGDEDTKEKAKLSDLTEGLSEKVGASYSDNEEELVKITSQLQDIETTSAFFEEEKRKQRAEKDAQKAQNIRDALLVGEEVSVRDRNWLAKYDELISQGVSTDTLEKDEENKELNAALASFEGDSVPENELVADDASEDEADDFKDLEV